MGSIESVSALQRVRADHAAEILHFEVENRAYFAAHISDRGDEYFTQFDQRHEQLLAEQETGRYAYYVLVDDDGSILGRFNLVGIDEGSAELGYRVAQRAAGCGVATTGVADVSRVAASELGLRSLRARTTHDNLASQRVLAKSGFVPIGAVDIGGRPGSWYERSLTTDGRQPPPAGRLPLE